MSRKILERRRIAQERWPLLTNLMASSFSQDFETIDGSLSGAINEATRNGSLEHRQALLKEWWNWNVSEGVVRDIRPFLSDGFSIEMQFETALEARIFMNRIYDGLISGIRAETR